MKKRIRKIRKNILRNAMIENERYLKEPGLPKREWGYKIRVLVGGFKCDIYADRPYECYKDALDTVNWFLTATDDIIRQFTGGNKNEH